MNNLYDNKNNNSDISVIRFGTVLDTNDPTGSQRIRVSLNNERFVRSNFEIWGKDDPYVCNPFLPKLINLIPKKNELVKIILYNPSKPSGDKEYVGPLISQLQNLEYESYLTGNNFYSGGQGKLKSNPPVAANGIYPDNDVFGLLGRGNADFLIKKNSISLRSGKYVNDNLKFNKKNSTFELSFFPNKLVINEELINQINIQTININYLVEYNITKSEIGYQGVVNLIKLKERTNLNFNLYTPLLTSEVSIGNMIFQFGQKEKVIEAINEFLKNLRDNKLKSKVQNENSNQLRITFDQSISPNTFYIRPNINLLNDINNNSDLVSIFKGITLDTVISYGLYSKKNIATTQTIKKNKTILTENTFLNVSLLKSDYLFLVSNDTLLPDKSKISLPTSNMGLTQGDLNNDLLLNTEGIARGEQTVKIFEKLIDAFLNHVHSGYGYQEVNKSEQINDLIKLKKQIKTLIVNDKIRIN